MGDETLTESYNYRGNNCNMVKRSVDAQEHYQ